MAKVRLPDAPGPRANSKPRERYGVLLEPPWNMPGYRFVQEDGAERAWWVPEKCCEVVE